MKSVIHFRPLLWPSIFTLFSFIILILLGSWQVKRLFWKNEVTTNYTKQFEKEIIYYNKNLKFSNDFEFRRIRINGKFFHNKETLIIGKTFEGNVGFHLVTPILTNDNKIVLINRGWISEKLKLQKARRFTLIKDEIFIDGIIRKPQKKGYFVPNNDHDGGFWFTIKPSEIKDALGLEKYDFEKNFYVDSIRSKNKKTLPIGISGDPNFRNQHLSYAITWYSLAITLIIIYFVFHFKEKRLSIKRNRL